MPQEALRPDYPTPIEGNLVHPDFPTAFRFPHIGEEAGKPGLFTTPNAASGLREARTPGFLRHSEGVRLRTARLMTNPEVLTHDFLSTMRHAHLNDLRENVLRPVSKELDPSLHGGKLPDEHYFFEHRSTRVPRDVREQQALGQDLGVVDERGRETAVGALANQTVFSGHDMPLELRNKSVEQLKEMGVRRVPAAFAKKYQSNFAGTGRVMRNFVDKPLDVWRAITLNARPAWMVNNLVGNAAQYALRYAGVDGAAAYLRVLLHTEKGDGKIIQLRNYTMRIPTLRRKYGRLFDEIAPELHGSGLYSANVKITHGGVYAGTKLERAAASRAAKAIGLPAKAVWYPIRAVGRGITSFEKHFAEAVPREAAMLREVEPVVRKLGLANQSVEDALHALSPRDVELAVDRVNDYLGDFNSMNAPSGASSSGSSRSSRGIASSSRSARSSRPLPGPRQPAPLDRPSLQRGQPPAPVVAEGRDPARRREERRPGDAHHAGHSTRTRRLRSSPRRTRRRPEPHSSARASSADRRRPVQRQHLLRPGVEQRPSRPRLRRAARARRVLQRPRPGRDGAEGGGHDAVHLVRAEDVWASRAGADQRRAAPVPRPADPPRQEEGGGGGRSVGPLGIVGVARAADAAQVA
jgi:hypothetical protein